MARCRVRFRGKVLLGQTEPAPRWQQVLDAINLAAGPMLGKEYAATYLPDASRKQAELIAGHVRDALIHAIDDGTLLDAAGKAKRAKSWSLCVSKLAPHTVIWTSPCNRWGGSFGGNMLIASTWRHAQEMKRIGKGNADRPLGCTAATAGTGL